MEFTEELKDKFNFIKVFMSLTRKDNDEDFPLNINLRVSIKSPILKQIIEIYYFHMNSKLLSIYGDNYITQFFRKFIINLHYIIISNLSTKDINNINNINLIIKDTLESLQKSIEISCTFWGGKTNMQLTNSVEQWHPDFKTQ